MLIIFVLSQKRDSSLCVIWIELGHVQVINEIDQLIFTNWGISSTSFLFKLLFKNSLEKHRISVIVEVNNLLNVLISGCSQIMK
jgi:hypothetical protein